jgi:hypothetical protein
MPRVSLLESGGKGTIERLKDAGRYAHADHDAFARAEARLVQLDAELQAEFCHFRARSRLGEGERTAPVDRFYLGQNETILSAPASTRAALVLSAVGCDWRA